MPQPALREEGEVEEDGGDDAAGDEERFEAVGARVGDVGYRLARIHRGEVRMAFHFPPAEEGE